MPNKARKKVSIEKWIKTMKIVFTITIVGILLTLFVGRSLVVRLDNGVEVKVNSELTYYLNVLYDGVVGQQKILP